MRVLGRQFAMAAIVGWAAAFEARGATLDFDFAQGDHGFTAAFVDYSATSNESTYEFASGYRSRPSYLGGAGSFYLSGHNRSDDLFMFMKKRLSGLEPDALYAVRFSVELASRYESGSVGIGGSPADNVGLKTGASRFEPVRVTDSNNWYRLNLDKGNQAQEGRDAFLIGTIGKPWDGTSSYVLIERNNSDRPLPAWTDETGRLWIFIGTDSGFEGATSLYYTRIIVQLDVIPTPLQISRGELHFASNGPVESCNRPKHRAPFGRIIPRRPARSISPSRVPGDSGACALIKGGCHLPGGRWRSRAARGLIVWANTRQLAA